MEKMTMPPEEPIVLSYGTVRDSRPLSNLQRAFKCEESREEESHLLSGQCTVYGDLTLKYSDLTSDDNLVGLFTEILARRDELDRVITPIGGGITNVGANPGRPEISQSRDYI